MILWHVIEFLTRTRIATRELMLVDCENQALENWICGFAGQPLLTSYSGSGHRCLAGHCHWAIPFWRSMDSNTLKSVKCLCSFDDLVCWFWTGAVDLGSCILLEQTCRIGSVAGRSRGFEDVFWQITFGYFLSGRWAAIQFQALWHGWEPHYVVLYFLAIA